LECHFGGQESMTDYVKQPLLSREGANLPLHRDA